MGTRHRAWVFTINNYTSAHEVHLQQGMTPPGPAWSYIVYGREKGASGTPHLQGYVEFKNAVTLRSAKKHLNAPTAHLEVRRGTAAEADAYCRKEDPNPMFLGTMSQQGRRNDIHEVVDSIKAGASFEDILDNADSFQSLQVARVALPYKEPKRDWVTKVLWYWGPPGCGKTHAAWFAHPGERVHKQAACSPKWWEGYDRHPIVIIDDIRANHFTYGKLLELTDRYPATVENKGGTRQFVPKIIYFTAPYHPAEMFADNGEDNEQFLRRISVIREFKEKYVGPIVTNNAYLEEEDELSPPPEPEEQGSRSDEEVRAQDATEG